MDKDKPSRNAEETNIEIGAGVEKARIKIPGGCKFTINGERAIRASELRAAAQMIMKADPEEIKGIPAQHKNTTIRILQATFKGFGDVIGVRLWP